MPSNQNPVANLELSNFQNSLIQRRADILFAIEAMAQLIACHEEETCPAIDVAKEAMMRLSRLL